MSSGVKKRDPLLSFTVAIIVMLSLNGTDSAKFAIYYYDCNITGFPVANELRLTEYDSYNLTRCQAEVTGKEDIIQVGEVTDECVQQFCAVCESMYENCRVCCYNNTARLESTSPPAVSTTQVSTTTSTQSCDVILNLSSSYSVKDIDDCLQKLLGSCKNSRDGVDCSSFPFFQEPRYCEDERNFLVCGSICRRSAPCVPMQCRAARQSVCLAFIRRGVTVDSEERVELMSSILFNYARELGNIGTIASSMNLVLGSVRRRRSRLNRRALQNYLMTFDEVFGNEFATVWTNTTFSATRAMWQAVDDTLIILTQSLANDSRGSDTGFSFKGNAVAFHIVNFSMETEKLLQYPSDAQRLNSSILSQVNTSIPFPKQNVGTDSQNVSSVAVGISVIDNFASYITASINKSLLDSNVPRLVADSVLLSAVVVDSDNMLIKDFTRESVEFCIMTQGNVDTSSRNANHTASGYFLNDKFNWDASGLNTTRVSSELYCIRSNHLTSFAILASPTGYSPSGIEEVALNVISYLGCAVSIVFLLLTLFILLLCRKKLKKGVLLYIHFNLALSLLLAMVVFVIGVEGASFNEELCVFVAALEQYLLLCAFFWMLGEGIMLYLLIVKVFGHLDRKWYLLLPFCWGIPLPIVSLSAGFHPHDYTTREGTVCWIDLTKDIRWTFLVPVILVICVNSVILVMTICSIARTRRASSTDNKESHRHTIVHAVKGAIVLLPLLGLTWVLGLFAINQNTAVFAWLFTIVNSLQGLSIFLLHIARNEYIWNATKAKLKKLSCRRKYATVSSDGNKTMETNLKSLDVDSSTFPNGKTNS